MDAVGQRMESNFVSSIGTVENNGSVYNSLFGEYERVVVRSLITSFGLDFLINDRHGGDVDTIHNVRKVGVDEEMKYKNSVNEAAYESRGEYNAKNYHEDSNFAHTKHTAREKYREDYQPIKDEYTGKENLGFFGKSKSAPSDKNAELDHIVECKQIHDDRGRVLSGLDGSALANADENFAFTNKSLNASMGAWARGVNDEYRKEHGCDAPMEMTDMKAYIKSHPELDETTKKNMLDHYKKARQSYEAKLNLAYYASERFWKDTGSAAAKLGVSMGLRQALGLVFAEIWFTVKDAIAECRGEGKVLFEAIANSVKKGLENAKKKFKDIWEKFIEGAVAGVLSSIVTTLTNIFFTTAKNIVKIIRESWASFTESCKILFVNPDCLPLGERFRAAAKVLATGASIVAGTMVAEVISKTPFGNIPVIGDIVRSFCGSLVTGIMSCSFLYIFDHNDAIQKAVEMLNKIPSVENLVASLKKQAQLLEKYLAELMEIDWEYLKQKISTLGKITDEIENARDDFELNKVLKNACKEMGVVLPWGEHENFDAFMNDKNARFVLA